MRVPFDGVTPMEKFIGMFASWMPSQISRTMRRSPMMVPAQLPFPPQAFAFPQMLADDAP